MDVSMSHGFSNNVLVAIRLKRRRGHKSPRYGIFITQPVNSSGTGKVLKTEPGARPSGGNDCDNKVVFFFVTYRVEMQQTYAGSVLWTVRTCSFVFYVIRGSTSARFSRRSRKASRPRGCAGRVLQETPRLGAFPTVKHAAL